MYKILSIAWHLTLSAIICYVILYIAREKTFSEIIILFVIVFIVLGYHKEREKEKKNAELIKKKKISMTLNDISNNINNIYKELDKKTTIQNVKNEYEDFFKLKKFNSDIAMNLEDGSIVNMLVINGDYDCNPFSHENYDKSYIMNIYYHHSKLIINEKNSSYKIITAKGIASRENDRTLINCDEYDSMEIKWIVDKCRESVNGPIINGLGILPGSQVRLIMVIK